MRATLRSLFCGALLLTTTLSYPASAATQPANEATVAPPDRLVGAWEVTVRPEGGPEFVNFATFNREGSIIGTPASAFESTAHGSWQRLGGSTFGVTFVGFLFDEQGNAIGLEKVVARIEVGSKPRRFDGSFELHVSDLDGSNDQVFPGTVVARPIEVELLPD